MEKTLEAATMTAQKLKLKEILRRHRARPRLPVFKGIEALFWSDPSMTADECLQRFEETYLGPRTFGTFEDFPDVDYVALPEKGGDLTPDTVFHVFLKDERTNALGGLFPCARCDEDFCLDHCGSLDDWILTVQGAWYWVKPHGCQLPVHEPASNASSGLGRVRRAVRVK
jgi:hypothetical protein